MTVLTKNQKKIYGPKPFPSYGTGAIIRAIVRYDDECGNGHNTFSITGEITTPESRRRHDIDAGGCIHEEISKAFPQLAPFIKWHLTSSDGPMHYLANTLYHASDKDYNGLRKGETRVTVAYEPWSTIGEGKEREFNHARASAVWLDATDVELSADDLREKLIARLPALMAEFRTAVESLGMVY